MDLDRKSGDYNMLQRKADSDRQVYQSLLAQQKELRVVANSRAEQRAGDGARRSAEVPDLAQPAPGLDHRDHGRAAGRVRPRVRDRVSRRHGQDARGHHAPAQAAAARPGAGDPRRARARSSPEPCRTISARRSDRCARRSCSRAAASGRGSSRVTSSQPLEGKTTTAANLAMALALGGSRVLLIDADMRRPGLHTTIGRRERHRPVAPAGGPGARPRRGSADDRAEPAS